MNNNDDFPDDYCEDDYRHETFGWVKSPEDVLDAKQMLEKMGEEVNRQLVWADRQVQIVSLREKELLKRENQVNALHKQVDADKLRLAEMEHQIVDETRAAKNEKLALDARKALLAIANVDVVEALNEILLQLELEEDPKEILKYMKRRREELEPKW